jgi:alpha-glucosidase/alpha-D-xyloside xylohydrolase
MILITLVKKSVSNMKRGWIVILAVFLLNSSLVFANDTLRMYRERPFKLLVSTAGTTAVRLSLIPLDSTPEVLASPVFSESFTPCNFTIIDKLVGVKHVSAGNFRLTVSPNPLSVEVRNVQGRLIQHIRFLPDGSVILRADTLPVLGMGGGGPVHREGEDWRQNEIQFNRNGYYDSMEPRYQRGIYGQCTPVPFLVGTSGWACFVAKPWVEVDLSGTEHTRLIPWEPHDTVTMEQNHGNQKLNLVKGRHPFREIIPGLFDLFVFDNTDPVAMMADYTLITSRAAMPPKWAMGFMQSHRTLENENQMIAIVDSFRAKGIPLDAVIYLGTGFCPRGWNTMQPSFAFNPEVFFRKPELTIEDLHRRNVKVVLHMVPYDRDLLPGLQGSIPPKPGEIMDNSHIFNYWKKHEPLIHSGVDAFWPDEGDWFNLYERINRYKMYYQGHLHTQPGLRPWSLLRNGFPGIAQWGGWIWSGDTESAWKSLEAQVTVGINTSLSMSPFWGSDIGGWSPNEELTGELYARWFQFGAFCPSFRAHGQTWWTRLPWGWGLSEMGPVESRSVPLSSELNNPAIEPICRKYAMLRYQLLTYNYALCREAANNGLPLMRAVWLHYPNDPVARGLGTQYLWGRNMMIAPVFKQGATRWPVYLPEGNWYDFWDNTLLKGGQTISREIDLEVMPIYVKEGTLLPIDPDRQYTQQETDKPITIRIYPGADASFSLYLDDGLSMAYQEREFCYIPFEWNDKRKTLSIGDVIKAGEVAFNLPDRFILELYPSGKKMETGYTGKKIRLKF